MCSKNRYHNLIIPLCALFALLCLSCDHNEVTPTSNTFRTTGIKPNKAELKKPERYTVQPVLGKSIKVPDTIFQVRKRKSIRDINRDSILMPSVQDLLIKQDTHILKTEIISTRKPKSYVVGLPINEGIGDMFTSLYSPSNGLKNDETLNHLNQDAAGHIWFTTVYSGLVRFDGYHFYYYCAQDGILEKELSDMLIDKNDNIWMVNEDGIVCFNGLHFKKYFSSEIAFNQIESIHMGVDGKIFLISRNGLFVFDPTSSQCEEYELKGEPNIFREAITVQDAKVLWIFTQSGDLYLLDIDEEAISKGLSYRKIALDDGLVESEIYAATEATSNEIILCTDKVVARLRRSESSEPRLQLEYIHHSDLGLGDLKPLNILTQGEDHFYIHMQGQGLMAMNIQDDAWQYLNFAFPSMARIQSTEMMVDKQGHMWISSENGALINIKKNPFIGFDDFGPFAQSMTRFAQSPEGDIWLGSYGGGLLRYIENVDKDIQYLIHYNMAQGMSSGYVDALQFDEKGDLWVGLRDYGLIRADIDSVSGAVTFFNYLEENGFPAGLVPSLALDHDGHIWGTLYEFGDEKTSGIFRIVENEILFFGIEQGLISHNTWDLDFDSQGNIWVSSISVGLNYIQLNGEDVPDVTQFNPTHHLPGLNIRALAVDGEDRVWVGAEDGDGLICMMRDTMSNAFVVHAYDPSDGLPSTKIISVMASDDGHLWVGTDKGFSTSDLDIGEGDLTPMKFINYDGRDGMNASAIVVDGLTEFDDGGIWLRGSVLHAEKTENEINPLSVDINKMTVFDEEVDWERDSTFTFKNGVVLNQYAYDTLNKYFLPQKLKLNYDNNFLSFEASAINVNTPHKIEYAFLLEGWSPDWSVPSHQRRANFGKLNPGRYVLRARARMKGQEWFEAQPFAFTIKPPWWKSYWAYLFYAFALGGIVYAIIQLRIKTELEKAKEIESLRNKISIDLHDDVGSMLTGIAMQTEFMAHTRTEQNEEELLKIGALSRSAMDKMRDIVWSMDTSKDSYDHLLDRMRYFAQILFEHSDFNYALDTVNIEGEESLSSLIRQNIYLVYKEALTNVAKHSNGDVVRVRLEKLKSDIIMVIQDNGTHTTIQKSGGSGLANMKKRINTLNGTFKTDVDNGFQIYVRIPM